MKVWFHPVAEPNIYAVDRSDPDNILIIVSEGMPVSQVVACAARFATVEERNWVREQMGYPPVHADPTYRVMDCVTNGETRWSIEMVPPELRWQGPPPQAQPGTSGLAVLAWAAAAAAVVGAVASAINGDSGLFNVTGL